MRLLVPINGNIRFKELATEHPERLGYVISPSYFQKPREGIPFALDNDAYRSFKLGIQFDFRAWMQMLDRVAVLGLRPIFAAVPDSVGNKEETLENWGKYHVIVEQFGFPTAFVLQDGIELSEVPKADVYFVGGSTEFKWTTAHFWCQNLPRVHVGRVRSRRLLYCDKIGAESCDGSGFLRETVNGRPFRQLEAWLFNCNVQYELKFNS